MDKEFVQGLMNTKKSARSLQKNVGPSEIGGCRRKVWMKLRQLPKVNQETITGSSWMGTAIHAAFEKALMAVDPWQDRYEREVEVSYAGITGHADVYDKQDQEVIDWKTTTKSKLAKFAGPQKWMQVNLYGYLLTHTGKPVRTVTLVGIPRDGDERHILYVSQPYEESIAVEGLQWLADVRDTVDAPDPEKPVYYCKPYCGYYDASGVNGCPGLR